MAGIGHLWKSLGGTLLCAVVAATVHADEPLCRTVAGDAFAGKLVSISGAGDVVFSVDGKQKQVPAEEFLSWGTLSDSPDGTQVFLSDGSVIVASEVALDGESLIVEANLFGEVKGLAVAGTSRIPVSALRAIVFRVPLRPRE